MQQVTEYANWIEIKNIIDFTLQYMSGASVLLQKNTQICILQMAVLLDWNLPQDTLICGMIFFYYIK